MYVQAYNTRLYKFVKKKGNLDNLSIPNLIISLEYKCVPYANVMLLLSMFLNIFA